MGWIGIILWVLTHAGDLISLVKEIMSLIHSLPQGQAALAKSEIGDAVDSGDHARLKSILEKWRERCSLSGGAGCGGGEVQQ